MNMDVIHVYNCLQGQFHFPDETGRGTAKRQKGGVSPP